MSGLDMLPLQRTDSVANDISFQCSNCKKSIPCGPNELWKTVCLECYKLLARKCETCNKNLSLKAEKWKKQCVPCYKSTKKITCPVCTKQYLLKDKTSVDDNRCHDCIRSGSITQDDEMSGS